MGRRIGGTRRRRWGPAGRLAEGAREAGEDAGESEAEAEDGAVGVGRAVAADGLHGLDEEAEAAHRRHVQRQRRRREGQRHEQLQHLLLMVFLDEQRLLAGAGSSSLDLGSLRPPVTRANPIR